jgi:site-specific recombinase XerD
VVDSQPSADAAPGIFRHAVRKGWRSDNPVKNLEAEKPALKPSEQRILEAADEIRKLLEARTLSSLKRRLRRCEAEATKMRDALEARFGADEKTARLRRV